MLDQKASSLGRGFGVQRDLPSTITYSQKSIGIPQRKIPGSQDENVLPTNSS